MKLDQKMTGVGLNVYLLLNVAQASKQVFRNASSLFFLETDDKRNPK